MMRLREGLAWFLVGVDGLFHRAVAWAAYLLSRLENAPAVALYEGGEAAALGPRVAVFCHFDGAGQVRAHTRRYIEALRDAGFDSVFVTNSGKLAAPDLAWARARAAHVVVRRNLGYDFAAWRDAMTVSGVPNAETRFLLIANDSVYGPVHPLGPVLEQIDFAEADVWSATDSWQHRFHLQSYFVAFGPAALRHEVFAAFWRSVANVRSKWWVVRRYEIGMSRMFTAAGLRCKALWPYVRLIAALREDAALQRAARRGGEDAAVIMVVNTDASEAGRLNAKRVLGATLRHTPMNPTADLWRVLIEQGCPFIKRELLRRNPSRVVDVSDWYAHVGQVDAQSRDLILLDLERSLRNRSP